MPEFRCARPFLYNSPAGQFEVGIAVYENFDQAFIDDPYCASFSESAVLARGDLLFQWRVLLILDPTSGAYKPIPGVKPAPIYLAPDSNGHIYTQRLESGWEPIFSELFDTFPQHPQRETGSGASLGYNGYRFFNDPHGRPIRSTIKLYNTDASPPVLRAGDIDAGRHDREERAHQRQQIRQLRTFQAITARYAPELPDPKPIPWKQSAYYSLVDQRDQRVAA